MTLPGWRLRAWAARWCEPRTMARLVDPILADLQVEHHEAVTQGSVWRSRLAWLRALVALARVGAMHSLCVRPYEERRHVSRALVVTAASFVGFVAVLSAPFALNPRFPHSLLVYLVPQAVPFAIPASLVCGMVFGLGQAQHRLRTWIVAASLVASCASLYVVASVVPASSQAFREAAESRLGIPGPVPIVQELTLRELWLQRTGFNLLRMLPARARVFQRALHTRLAVACAPLVLAVLVLSVARGRRWLDAGMAMAIVLGYFSSFRWVDLVYQSPIAKAWVPNAICLVLATGSLFLRWERARHEVVRQ